MIIHLPISTLFPYTTLFRSLIAEKIAAEPEYEEYLDFKAKKAQADKAQRSNTSTSNPSYVTIAVDDDLEYEDSSRSEEHTSELQSHSDLVCRLLLEKKKKKK